jgi:hypothetical protein
VPAALCIAYQNCQPALCELRPTRHPCAGENLYDDVEGEDADSRTRRLRLLQAVEGDDWSGVIDGQTQETLTDPQAERAAAAAAAIEATKVSHLEAAVQGAPTFCRIAWKL